MELRTNHHPTSCLSFLKVLFKKPNHLRPSDSTVFDYLNKQSKTLLSHFKEDTPAIELEPTEIQTFSGYTNDISRDGNHLLNTRELFGDYTSQRSSQPVSSSDLSHQLDVNSMSSGVKVITCPQCYNSFKYIRSDDENPNLASKQPQSIVSNHNPTCLSVSNSRYQISEKNFRYSIPSPLTDSGIYMCTDYSTSSGFGMRPPDIANNPDKQPSPDLSYHDYLPISEEPPPSPAPYYPTMQWNTISHGPTNHLRTSSLQLETEDIPSLKQSTSTNLASTTSSLRTDGLPPRRKLLTRRVRDSFKRSPNAYEYFNLTHYSSDASVSSVFCKAFEDSKSPGKGSISMGLCHNLQQTLSLQDLNNYSNNETPDNPNSTCGTNISSHLSRFFKSLQSLKPNMDVPPDKNLEILKTNLRILSEAKKVINLQMEYLSRDYFALIKTTAPTKMIRIKKF